MNKHNTSNQSIEVLKNELREMEKLFCETTSHEGAKGWSKFFSDNGVMLSANSSPITGPEAIEAYMKEAFFLKEFKIIWRPLHIDVSPDGVLGYTYGTYTRSYLNKENELVEEMGKYMTVWKRHEDGQWLIEADIGN